MDIFYQVQVRIKHLFLIFSGLHTDLPYYNNTPSTQWLHCINQFQGEGGENEFVDSFAIAENLRQNFPEIFKILTEKKVAFSDLGYDEVSKTSFYKIRFTPTIKLNSEGEIEQIYYNNQVRARILFDKDLYKALKIFDNFMYSKEFLLDYKLENGDCVVFDNNRVMHGRKGFEISGKSPRIYHGCYVSWDEIWSRMNVIKFLK